MIYFQNMDTTSRLQHLLSLSAQGDRQAESALIDLVYGELRKIASALMRRERKGHTLQTSALVNEAYLRLAKHQSIRLESRAMFFTSASRAMRRVLVEHARQRNAAKRSGDQVIHLESVDLPSIEVDRDRLLAMDQALDELATLDERQARIVELRYFGGLSIEETAAVVGISDRSVKREWATARAWLKSKFRSV